MSLERFSNKEQILETDGPVRAITWNESDLDILQLDLKYITPEERPVVELHLYTIGQESVYIAGGIISDFEVVKNKLYINYGKAVQSLGIERGQFEVLINVYKNLLGSEDSQDLYINQISDDRREIWIKGFPNTDLDINSYLDSFGNGAYHDVIYETRLDPSGNEVVVLDENNSPIIKTFIERPLSDDIALNFGDNKIFKIINQKDWDDENDFVVRLYKPLPDEIEEKTPLWTIEQLSDSYVDNIDISGIVAARIKSKKILGPNFNVDVNKGTITETDFKDWNTLLDASTSTSQQIVDKMFSGSLGGVDIGIDYSGFQNFVHFSSATERLANFKYKLSLIEYYDTRLDTLNAASSTTDTSLLGNITTTTRRKNSIIGSFDGFESWLYNSPTSSLFTHHDNVYSDNNNKSGVYRADGGYLGAKSYQLTSWPKYLSGSKYYLHKTTDSISENYYNGWYDSASFYDNENNNALAKTIPEHIRLDSNNDQYELFVNMIGHHYDILYSYIENLTKVYKPEEHPSLGQSKETLYQVAKSLGWSLSNGNQASQLWQYKLGVDSGSGKYQSTGSLFSKSDEEITTEVWRRIVNNLPYLLKTKGTTRSVKALMNTYGIPQTLLSIREYGGPKVSGDVPTLIEDRFSYALNIPSGSSIKFVRSWYSSSIGDKWGIADNYDATKLGGFNANERPPDTIEFRFKPAITQSMHMLSHEGTSAGNDHWSLGIEHTGSYSGSGKYGRLFFQFRTFGGDAGNVAPEYTTVSDNWVPLYDGDFWNVRLFTEWPFVTASHSTPTVPRIFFQAQKASDYISGKIIHRTSGSLNPGSGSSPVNGDTLVKYWANQTENKTLYLGGRTGSGLYDLYAGGTFTGAIQEYREWMEVLSQETFDFHTLNPTSYVSSISPTSSYDTLVRHYPLGTDLNAVDHSVTTGLYITSSHPNSTITDFSPPYPDSDNAFATAHNFPTPANIERGNYDPVEETYYIQGISLGGNVPRSQKIRLESNELVRRLSPTNTAERSRFDRAPIDTNKLGLYYSAADQINKEIFNHIGDVELDDYVGDPDDEIKSEYPDLSSFSKEYWKKYSDKNDINAYMRIFNQFDFALFDQIKQLLPERVDEAMGLLIEPHALERVKICVTKRPVITNPQYNVTLPKPIPSSSADILLLSSSIDMPYKNISGESNYHIGDNGAGDIGNHVALFTVKDPYEAATYKHIYTTFPYNVDSASAASLGLPMEITSSLSDLTTSPLGSIILDQRSSRVFDLVTFYYGTGSATSKWGKNYNKALSQSLGLSYSQSLSKADYRDDFNVMTENQKYNGSQLIGPGINIASQDNAIGQKPVVEIFATNPNTLIYNDQPSSTNPGSLDVR